MDEQKQDDQLELIFKSFVPIQDEALKAARERWTIAMGGEIESGRSVLAVRHDNDIYPHFSPVFVFTPKNLSLANFKL